MREAEVPVTFRPMDKTAYALKGTGLAEAAAGAGVVLDQPCGGVGKCGKCRVLVADGVVEPTPAEIAQFSAGELQSGYRLACQSTVAGPMTVEVPEASLLASHHQILAGTGPTPWEIADDPPVRKQYVELPPPARNDDAADLMRLERAIGPFRVDLELLRSLPGRLRASGFRGTAVLSDGRLIDFEPQNTEAETFGVAVDVGTTTLAAVLLNLNASRLRQQRPESNVLDEGGELATVTRLNPQTRLGDDVLSRIHHVQQDPDGLAHLRDLVIRAVDEMIGELADRVGIGRERIYEVTFSGNTTMQQLLCGIDPSSLGEVPFTPAADAGWSCPAGEMGLHLHPRGRCLRLARDRRIRRRRHGGRHPGHGHGRGPGADLAGRHRHQRRDRPVCRRQAFGRLDRRRPRLRGGADRTRHAGQPRRDREGGLRRPACGST